jgi:hypothetical protein
MGKKLTQKQEIVVRRVANKMGMSDVTVGSIVSEFLGEQSARRPSRRQPKSDTVCPECGKSFKSAQGVAQHVRAKHEPN